MTAEQQKTVETIRGLMQSNRQWAVDTGGWVNNAEILLEIIDGLQKQQPKRYTEDELRDIVFEKLQRFLPMQFGKMQERMLGWLECARFLGMIKTEGEL